MLETKRTAFCPRKAHLQPFPMPAMLILFSASAAGSVAALGDPVQARCSDLLAEALRTHERQLAEIRSSKEKVIRELRVQLDGRTAELDGLRRTCAATKHEFANTARAKNETWRPPQLPTKTVGRALLRSGSSTLYCSKSLVRSVLDATEKERVSMITQLLPTNPECARCIMSAGSMPFPDKILGIHGCQHQEENRCDETTGLSRIVPLIPLASVHDSASLIRMIDIVDAGGCVAAHRLQSCRSM